MSIRIDVLQPTESITLNALELSFSSARLSGDSTSKLLATPGIKIDATNQTATFDFERAIPVGSYNLVLDHTGKISTQAAGLFAIDYDTAAGRKRAIYTQFEAADARRFIPCWDEPNYKATFSPRATIPAGQMAVNSREAAMSLDVLKTTHPVVQRIDTVEQASQAFDSMLFVCWRRTSAQRRGARACNVILMRIITTTRVHMISGTQSKRSAASRSWRLRAISPCNRACR